MAAARRRRGGTPCGGQAADEVGRFIGPSPAGFKADDDETAAVGVLELGVDLVAFKAAPGVVSDRSRAAPSRPTGLTRVVSTVVLRDRAADREQGLRLSDCQQLGWRARAGEGCASSGARHRCARDKAAGAGEGELLPEREIRPRSSTPAKGSETGCVHGRVAPVQPLGNGQSDLCPVGTSCHRDPAESKDCRFHPNGLGQYIASPLKHCICPYSHLVHLYQSQPFISINAANNCVPLENNFFQHQTL